ncbi:MAG: valine--tRNA ligase [Candidatus Sumerlaeia bacterium]
MCPELSKHYDPKALESQWYQFWEERGYFHDEPDEREHYSIVIPPPNITGRLHMGHALNNSLQDVLTRWKRMCGYNALWLPGTDHAGIATQNRVEKELRAEGIDRREMGRDAFVDRVWEWRDEYGNLIIEQLRKMGCSCDWQRTRFTLDKGLSRAVHTVFKRLYDEGLIYRGSYMVNWCPQDQTALSDDEVEYREVQGHLWHIRYPMDEGLTIKIKVKEKDADGREREVEKEVDYITVATTRPETMLGDTAVAFNPDDERYQALKGKHCILPLMDRKIPFIADDHVDKSFGTGLVKVTPAHDPNDYEMGKRHELEMINILSPDGCINQNGGHYKGMDRFVARKKIVADLENEGLLERVEKHTHQVGHSYRSDAIVEPYISEQWFVRMKPLVGPAIEAVEKGDVRFVPKSWENTYFHWVRNVRDWCISRQLWWGHQIPVWYCEDCDHVNVSDADGVTECEKCGSKNLRQDEDVLDTWFSSALWPFSTMGWPDETKDLKFYYPTNALLTAHEIIFFWVARMIVMGLKFMGDVPFRDVYIHPMVFDEKTRKKMSKSLGNIIDPLEMIDKYGSDAMRMTVCAYAVKGANLYLSEERFEGYRNFMNKFWNSARFVMMNLEDLAPEEMAKGVKPEDLEIEDRWILGALADTIDKVDSSLANYEFDQYVHHLYHFIWGEYCDWYLELVKSRLYEKTGETDPAKAAASKRSAQIVLVSVLETMARLMQPVAPFISEEVWQNLRERFGGAMAGSDNAATLGLTESFQKESIMIAPWPGTNVLPQQEKAETAKMTLLMDAISAIRKIRSEMGVQPAQAVDVAITGNEADRAFLQEQAAHLEALAKTGKMNFGEALDEKASSLASTAVAGSATISVALPAELIEAEKARLAKELEKLEKGLTGARKKLDNPSFVEKAPEAVVQKERERLEQMEQQCEVLRNKLKELA